MGGEKIGNLLCSLDIEKDKKVKAMLLYAGDKVYVIYYSLAIQGISVGQLINGMKVPVEYDGIKLTLMEYFTPKIYFL